ncbi:MAG: lysozyme inhibitor LprI family protein [Rhodospirillales bacterium]
MDLLSGFALAALLLTGEPTAPPAFDPPPFDCAKASAPDDRLICEDTALTRLDARLGRVYVILRNMLAADASERLKEDQRAWVFRRNAGCGVAPTTVLTGANLLPIRDCFRAAYAERLALLELAYDVLRPRRRSAGPPAVGSPEPL